MPAGLIPAFQCWVSTNRQSDVGPLYCMPGTSPGMTSAFERRSLHADDAGAARKDAHVGAPHADIAPLTDPVGTGALIGAGVGALVPKWRLRYARPLPVQTALTPLPLGRLGLGVAYAVSR